MSFAEPECAPVWSLRRRLLVRSLIVVALLWVATSALALYSARGATTAQLDDSLRRAASLLMGFAEHEYAETAGSSLAGITASEELPRGGFMYQIWSDHGVLQARSEGAPEQALGSAAEGYSDLVYEQQNWRLLSMWNSSRTLHLLFAEPQRQRQEALADLSLSLLLPMLLALPLVSLLLLAALERGLRPAQAAAEALVRRADDNSGPIALNEFPLELRALVQAFNALLLRLSKVLQSERQFADHVAHELRTPLAAIRLQAQLIERAPDDASARHALDGLFSGVDRTGRLVDQLLTLARLDPSRGTDQDQEVFSLLRIVDETVAEFEQPLRQRQQRVEVVVQNITLYSSPHAVYVVLRNLLDNAIRHAPVGSTVRLAAAVDEGQLRLEVSDQGPGIPVAERERVLERFARLTVDGHGSGLGLFIVHRIAQVSGGRVSISDAVPVGACVTVSWPLRDRG